MSPEPDPSLDPEWTQLDVDAAQAQEPDAFARLFERFAEKLHVVTKARIGTRLQQRIDADDIIQETFITAWLNLGKFRSRGRGSFFGWLCTVADRRIKDAARFHGGHRRDMKREIAGGAAGEDEAPLLLRLAASLTSPSSLARRREMQERLLAAVDALPDDEREVFIYRELEGRSLEWTSQRLEVPKSTVSDRHGRARENIARMLGRD